MGLLQTFARPSGARREKPGPTRGDLVLVEDDLPSKIAGWKRTGFTPAPLPEELPKGQYWWVHQWRYATDKTSADDDLTKWHDGLRRDSSVETTERQSDEQNVIYRTPNDKTAAIVSFDQLGGDQWHELTYCYRILDWTIHNRTEYEDADGGAYIVAELRKEPNEVALLVFSVFFEDGTWATPPTVNLNNLNQWNQATGVLDKATERIAPPQFQAPRFTSPSSGHTRALQSQVLVANADSNIESRLSAAIELHLESRQRFRSEWLAFRSMSLELNSEH